MYKTKTISVAIITIFAAITIISSSSLFLFIPLQLQLIENRNYNDYANDDGYNYYHTAFAYHGKEISQTLNSAHFLPLTGNNESYQIKVVVNYSVTEPSFLLTRI
jgi:hypothetical protein